VVTVVAETGAEWIESSPIPRSRTIVAAVAGFPLVGRIASVASCGEASAKDGNTGNGARPDAGEGTSALAIPWLGSPLIPTPAEEGGGVVAEARPMSPRARSSD